MAKLYLKGKNEPLEVSEEVGMQIEAAQHGKQKFIKLQDGEIIDISSIKAFMPSLEVRTAGKRLCKRIDEPEIRENIKTFECELESYIPSDIHDIHYYGLPVTFPKQTPEAKEKYKDWVINPLIGGWHKNVIQYAIDNCFITRIGLDDVIACWSIQTEGDTSIHYSDFYEKLMALRELQRRRDFAEGKNMAYNGAAYQEVKETAKMILKTDKLPF